MIFSITTLAAIVLIFTAATLVVGAGTFTTTEQSAYAYKKDNGKGNGNGNTVTIQKCKQAAIQSGWDNTQEQECENLICTHPGENATCVQEGVVVTPTPTPTPVKSPCEQCFTSLLFQTQINTVVADLHATSLADLCRILEQNNTSLDAFQSALDDADVSLNIQAELIACLRDLGIVFLI